LVANSFGFGLWAVPARGATKRRITPRADEIFPMFAASYFGEKTLCDHRRNTEKVEREEGASKPVRIRYFRSAVG
jgi:hypothetical protein